MAMKKKTRRTGNTRPRPSRTSGRNALTRVGLQFDTHLARRWKQCLQTLLWARREGASAFDGLWQTVATIVDHDPPLYLAGGFATTRAFLAAYLDESERTARRLIRVARYASPAEESRYGISKIDAVIDLLEARAHGPAAAGTRVDFSRLRVPLQPPPGTGPRSVSFADATVVEIRAATRHITHPNAGRGKRSPVERAIAEAVARGPLAQVTVTVRNGRVSLANIPLQSLPQLKAALSKLKLPPTD